MKKCLVWHAGIYGNYIGENAIIKDGLVFLQDDDNKLYLPKEMFLAEQECEGGLIPFEVQGKWGFADIYTGQIKIEPVWDYAGPFYGEYAHVELGTEGDFDSSGPTTENGGKHGLIDMTGKVIIPVEYDVLRGHIDHCLIVANNEKWGIINYKNSIIIPLEWDKLIPLKVDYDIPQNYYKVKKNEKWGIINYKSSIIIPLEWDELRKCYNNDWIFCGKAEPCEPYTSSEDKLLAKIFDEPLEPRSHKMKWGVFDKDFNLIINPELDEVPEQPMPHKYPEYYLLKKGRRYGVLSKDGKMISDIKLFKKDAIKLIRTS